MTVLRLEGTKKNTPDSGNNSNTEGEEKPKPHPMKVIRIKATNTDLSFIGIDGITYSR